MRGNAFVCYLISFLFAFILVFPPLVNAEIQDAHIKIENLQKKVAKGYSSKFCNAIAMGFSKDSAARLSIEENSNPKYNPSLWMELMRSGNKDLSKIDQQEISEKIGVSISNNCGQAIGIKTVDDLDEFNIYFAKMQSTYSTKE